MGKNITLALPEETYRKFVIGAKRDHRSVSNFITTLALRKLEEEIFVDPSEMAEIERDKNLVQELNNGLKQAKERKGRFV
jgi:predicted CopG family antitoxin